MADKDDEGKLSASQQEKICARARKRFEACIGANSEDRREALEDWKFRNGQQWDDTAKRIRGDRPMLTINKTNTFVHQITNDQRQNRPSIDISPLGNKADKKTAQVIKGYVKELERNSNADIAYDTGFEWAVTCGDGYWRIVPEYEDERSMGQVLRVRRIRNGFTVYLDPSRQEPDGSDSGFGFLTDMVPRDEFETEHPKADSMQWTQGGIGDAYKHWANQNEVRVAEYFEVECETKRLVELQNGHIGFFDDLADELKKQEFVSERDAECKYVMWYKLTGKQVLDHRKLPIPWIPI